VPKKHGHLYSLAPHSENENFVIVEDYDSSNDDSTDYDVDVLTSNMLIKTEMCLTFF